MEVQARHDKSKVTATPLQVVGYFSSHIGALCSLRPVERGDGDVSALTQGVLPGVASHDRCRYPNSRFAKEVHMAYDIFSGSGRCPAALALAAILAACSLYTGPPSEADVKAHLPAHYQKDLQVVRIHPGIKYGDHKTHDVSKCFAEPGFTTYPVLITYTNVRNNPPCRLGKPLTIWDTCGAGTATGVLQGFCFWRESDGSWAPGNANETALFDRFQGWK
jgi:hypothetical protein